MKKLLSIITALIAALIITGCSGSTTDEGSIHENELTVYTSIYPIQYITEQIGGDAISVKTVYPPGADAHTYEPTSREMTAIAKGDAFIYLGSGMESFTESAAKALQNQDVKFIEIAAINESLFSKADANEHSHEEHNEHGDTAGHDEHDHHGDKDPHIWLDPLRMIQVGEIVKNELSELNPKQTETFNKNFDIFKETMINLDEEFKQTLQRKEQKHILVAHAAYGYWEERYGIEQIAISGLSTSHEPSQKELAQIVEVAKENNLKYVIFEQVGTDRVANIIREHIHAEALHIHNLESLTDEDIKNDADYVSIMKKNLEVLDKAMN